MLSMHDKMKSNPKLVVRQHRQQARLFIRNQVENESVKHIFRQRPKSNTEQEENCCLDGTEATRNALRCEEANDWNPEYGHDVPFIITKVLAEIALEEPQRTVCRRHYPFLEKRLKAG